LRESSNRPETLLLAKLFLEIDVFGAFLWKWKIEDKQKQSI
jgi:hypothetical protein